MKDAREHAEKVRMEWRRARRERPKQRDEFQHRLLSIFRKEEDAWFFGRVQRQSELAPDQLPTSLTSLTSLSPSPTETEWEGLISLIGLTRDGRKAMTDPIEVRQKSLFVLPDRRVILIDLANAMDALWDAFEKIAKSDDRFFDSQYQPKKAKWLEEQIVEYLAKIFPKVNIFSDLSYPDLTKTGKATAELDIAVSWGPFLVLVEAKAKQFRLESQLGDVGRLRTDIKKNVEDAFEQARRAAKYIADTPKPELTEIATGRKLLINKKKIQRTYLLTVSLHQLANLATRLAVFQDLGLFKDGEYPLSISLADLEFVTEFCDGPDVFLHYIQTRLDLQKTQQNLLIDELDFLGAYLVRSATLTPGRFRRLVHQVGDTVISIVATLDQPYDRLSARTEMITAFEKYRRKAPKSIGFGIMVLETKVRYVCHLPVAYKAPKLNTQKESFYMLFLIG